MTQHEVANVGEAVGKEDEITVECLEPWGHTKHAEAFPRVKRPATTQKDEG